MGRLAILAALTTLAACGDTQSGTDTPDVSSAAQYALGGAFVTITYNPETEVYLVTPTNDEALRFESNPNFPREGFDRANWPSDIGVLLTQVRDGSRVALVSFGHEDSLINFDRAANSSVPASGGATYSGDYLAILFLDGIYAAEITGDATLTASFGTDAEISGTITNRELFPVGIGATPTVGPENLVLSLNPLTADGRVALDGPTSPTVTSADTTFFFDTYTLLQGRYGGTLAGVDAAHFIGGVEAQYVAITGSPVEAWEFGAIATSR